MKTEQLWLRLYSNLPDQSEVVNLRMKLGWEGFGIYIGILCLLRGSRDGSLPTDFSTIGWLMRCSSGMVKSIVMDFGLFTLTNDGGRFFDQNLIDEMERYQSLLDERRKAGQRGAEKRWGTKADQSSNEDATPITDLHDETIANATKNVTHVTDFDAIKEINKET